MFCRIASVINLTEVQKELDFVENYLDGLNMPTANTHDDGHFMNIIYDDKSGMFTR